MTTADQVRKMEQQRKATYGLINPVVGPTPAQVLIASGVSDPMVGGNITVFPLGIDGDVPSDITVSATRAAPGGTVGNVNVDTISDGVGGSFRIHSDSAIETSTFFYQVFSAVGP